MKLTLESGETHAVRAGQALTGLRIASAEVNSFDVLNPQFVAWFVTEVVTRFIPREGEYREPA